MDFGSTQLYTFELWSSSGIRIADISALCQNRKYTLERNEAEILTFDVDLYAFEAFCAGMSVDPHVLITPYQTDVKVKRNGVYLFGTQVVAITFDLAADFSRANESGTGGKQTTLDQKVTITCQGYLNLFKDRYISITYTAQDACFIAGDLLTQTQAIANGSVGVTLDPSLYLTGVNRDRTYIRQNIKAELQNLTQLVDGRFDFNFDSNKQFHTYAQIGNNRTDIGFAYGGGGSNIIGFYLDRNAASLFNEIIGLGSGTGGSALISTQDDTTSQLAYYLRQDIKQYNSVTIQSELDQNSKADLALEKDLLELPQITITGKELQKVNTFLTPGDRIPISVVSHPWLSNINGIYRIEKMVVTIDENDFESEINLYFDNFAVVAGT